jgi:hypothetical protein
MAHLAICNKKNLGPIRKLLRNLIFVNVVYYFY